MTTNIDDNTKANRRDNNRHLQSEVSREVPCLSFTGTNLGLCLSSWPVVVTISVESLFEIINIGVYLGLLVTTVVKHNLEKFSPAQLETGFDLPQTL